MIPYGKQSIDQSDIDAVVAVLQSDFLTQGPMIPKFEQAMVAKCNAQYGVAVNSATSALHLLCLALDLGPGDWLWTSPLTFAASANCALHCGARIDFVDIDNTTANMCPKALEAKLIQAEQDGCLPKIVIPVHFSGYPCDMKSIHDLAQRFGFKIIEDASHALGSYYHGKPIGCNQYSDATVFSFHPVKSITTGEGGMVLTNDKSIADRLRLLRNHGITRDESLMIGPSHGPWYYQLLDLGFNFRMTDLQAALGISQLERLDLFINRRQELAKRYNEQLNNLPLTLPNQHPDFISARHLYVIRLDLDAIILMRREVFNQLREQGIGVNVHYIPVHLHPYYQKLGFKPGQFPVAERFYAEAISLPLYPRLSDQQQEQVISTLHAILSK